MTASSAVAATVSRARRAVPPVWVPWAPGPVRDPDGSVVVSVTEFTPHSRRHVHTVLLDGLRLREGWYGMEGAVGLLLYAQPTLNRGGSVSVWSSEAALRRFVALPRHVEIMRRYRPLGVVRATTWVHERFDRERVESDALGWLDRQDPRRPR